MKGPDGLRKNVWNIDDPTTKVLHKSLIISNLEYSTTLSYDILKPTYAIPIRVPVGSQISSEYTQTFWKSVYGHA